MNKRTKTEIRYCVAPYGHVATVPVGAELVPANNLPQGGFWVLEWHGISETEAAWVRGYGIHISKEEAGEDKAMRCGLHSS